MADIHRLDVPDVDGADRVKESMDTFVVDSMTTVGAITAGTRQLQQLERLVREGKTTVSDLEAIKGPFEHGFKKSHACQSLKPSQDT